ncbi:hypothetical protein DID77_04110 [Candidatus Marinamargulisbacteria bacterium SCGC AG-439-L15]|nr:hypothetical protein DID77_04110 [Candidatus Marinamargulisbacteria bacterium SCGC AG-439-L15]
MAAAAGISGSGTNGARIPPSSPRTKPEDPLKALKDATNSMPNSELKTELNQILQTAALTRTSTQADKQNCASKMKAATEILLSKEPGNQTAEKMKALLEAASTNTDGIFSKDLISGMQGLATSLIEKSSNKNSENIQDLQEVLELQQNYQEKIDKNDKDLKADQDKAMTKFLDLLSKHTGQRSENKLDFIEKLLVFLMCCSLIATMVTPAAAPAVILLGTSAAGKLSSRAQGVFNDRKT